jgi:hypothetical protein
MKHNWYASNNNSQVHFLFGSPSYRIGDGLDQVYLNRRIVREISKSTFGRKYIAQASIVVNHSWRSHMRVGDLKLVRLAFDDTIFINYSLNSSIDEIVEGIDLVREYAMIAEVV